MKNVIITGATSFVGMAVTESLLQNNVNVLAVVRPHSMHLDRLPTSKHLSILELELSEITALAKMKLPHFEVFYHFAWDGVRAPARDDVSLQKDNYTSALKAIITADAIGCEVFIGAGSQAEYGSTDSKIDENNKTNPTTPYGKAKLDVCDFGITYGKEHSIRFIWPRIFSLYGIHDSENTLIMSCLRKMKSDNAIDLSSCTQMWDYLYANDAAQALYLLGKSSKANGVYNIASGNPRPLIEFVQEMKQITGSKSQLNFGGIQNHDSELFGFEPNVNRLKNELDWSPQINFRDGITRIINHMER